jgi:hypothetical protein
LDLNASDDEILDKIAVSIGQKQWIIYNFKI